ncbi:RICIN domain-containing protein [Streptomyces sp. URMC 124]|uniref:RICIN domain-containing protein n=1 Tax=Streptomyces sp. URMC 124 TaxID=3423405 RepID=UPI003F1B6D27
MTLDECKRYLVGEQVYFKSRFAVCSGVQFRQIWADSKGVGETSFQLYLRATVPKYDRVVHFEYDFVDINKSGRTPPTADLLYHINSQMPLISPKTAVATYGGAVPPFLSWDQLKGMKPNAHFLHTVTVAPGQGMAGSTDLVFGAYQPDITLTAPPGWQGTNQHAKPFVMAPRWDAASYLRTTEGSATFSFMPTLGYSNADDAPEKGVAEHILLAYTNPSATYPKSPQLKDIPGREPKNPLHRLQNDPNGKRHDRSNALAVQACKARWGDGYTQGGTKDCDEFPFASTYEGASQYEWDPHTSIKNNFSAMPVDSKQNRDAGTILNGFYAKNRILDGVDDGFLVSVSHNPDIDADTWVNRNSGKCLEIENSSKSNGARAQQWDCSRQPGSKWMVTSSDGVYVNIINVNSGKCLEVADSRRDDGAPVQQWTCAGNDTQKWNKLFVQSDPNTRVFRNANSGKVLEIDGSSKDNGARAQQWENKGQPGSYWTESWPGS